MAQLGKYSSDRDNILHYMATCDWALDSFGDVEAPTGYVWCMSNTFDDVSPKNGEFNSLIEAQLEAYDIDDSDSFRESLAGHFLIIEDSNGFVSVLEFPNPVDRNSIFDELSSEYAAWAGDDEN